MAYGGIVQSKISSQAARVALTNYDLTFDSAPTAGNTIVAVSIINGGSTDVTVTHTGGIDTFTSRYHYSTIAATKVSSCENIQGTGYTVRFTTGASTPGISVLAILEIEADASTTFEQGSQIADNGSMYSEIPNLAIDGYTDSTEGFALAIGSQNYQGGNNTSTDLTQFDWYASLGAPGGVGSTAFGEIFHTTFDDNTTMYAIWENAGGARGASINADGVILVWGKNSDPLPDYATAAFVSNLVVNTENNGSTGTSGSVSISPAAVAGHTLMCFFQGRDFAATGAITPPAGWTAIATDNASYWIGYKVATGGDSCSFSWVNSVAWQLIYAEFNSSTPFNSPTNDLSTGTAFSAGPSSRVPLATKTGADQYWVMFWYEDSFTSATAALGSDLRPNQGDWETIVGRNEITMRGLNPTASSTRPAAMSRADGALDPAAISVFTDGFLGNAACLTVWAVLGADHWAWSEASGDSWGG